MEFTHDHPLDRLVFVDPREEIGFGERMEKAVFDVGNDMEGGENKDHPGRPNGVVLDRGSKGEVVGDERVLLRSSLNPSMLVRNRERLCLISIRIRGRR